MRQRLRGPRLWFLSGILALFVLLFLLLLNANMRKELNHDEHQFIAAGALAGQSLIPYRDYPYTHTPYLAIIYGALFSDTDHLLLAGRGLSTICDFAALGLVFFVTSNLFKDRPHSLRFGLAAGAVMLLFTNPLFMSTTGFAWNHAAPELAALAAFILQSHGARHQRGMAWTFISGALLGVAAGLRVTFALAIIPVGSLIVLSPGPAASRARLRLLLSFAAGVGLGMLPALLMLALYPQQFIFNVVRYPQLDAIWRRQIGYTEAMTPSAEVGYFVLQVLRDPGNLMLAFSFALSLWALSAAGVRARLRENAELTAILILVPFLLIGSFVKVPLFYQYFYAPVPFVVLGTAYAIAAMGIRGVRLLPVLALAVVVSGVYGLPQYLHVGRFLSFDTWVPLQAHHLGVEIRRTAGAGRILTLAPIFPLEGGAKIYCGFAAAPFTWRSAHLLPAAERGRVGIVSAEDLNQFLKGWGPAAVLVGFEGKLETPLTAYAQRSGYKRSRLSNGADLWISPDDGAAHRENPEPGTQARRTSTRGNEAETISPRVHTWLLQRAQRTDVGMEDPRGNGCPTSR